jgi:hypothetical protein
MFFFILIIISWRRIRPIISLWDTFSTIAARIISITWWWHSHCAMLALSLHLPSGLWELLFICNL